MVRSRHEHRTPAEREVLQVLWERGSGIVREVMGALNGDRSRACTSVMSVMEEEDRLRSQPQGRAFIDSAEAS